MSSKSADDKAQEENELSDIHRRITLTHTGIYFLGLLTFYLGIKPHFEVSCLAEESGLRDKGLEGSESWAKSLADSEAPEQAPAHAQTQSFTTGFALLLSNVCTMCRHSLVAGDALGNLWIVYCNGELGCRSHSTIPTIHHDQTPNVLGNSSTPPSWACPMQSSIKSLFGLEDLAHDDDFVSVLELKPGTLLLRRHEYGWDVQRNKLALGE
ncbi:hypothetical protein F4604DRAFT_1905608 [Suillus subluteus]|nr:hypothetical protein F4604DRAFT_1905608 [Suillus subluteus]